MNLVSNLISQQSRASAFLIHVIGVFSVYDLLSRTFSFLLVPTVTSNYILKDFHFHYFFIFQAFNFTISNIIFKWRFSIWAHDTSFGRVIFPRPETTLFQQTGSHFSCSFVMIFKAKFLFLFLRQC